MYVGMHMLRKYRFVGHEIFVTMDSMLVVILATPLWISFLTTIATPPFAKVVLRFLKKDLWFLSLSVF